MCSAKRSAQRTPRVKKQPVRPTGRRERHGREKPRKAKPKWRKEKGRVRTGHTTPRGGGLSPCRPASRFAPPPLPGQEAGSGAHARPVPTCSRERKRT